MIAIVFKNNNSKYHAIIYLHAYVKLSYLKLLDIVCFCFCLFVCLLFFSVSYFIIYRGGCYVESAYYLVVQKNKYWLNSKYDILYHTLQSIYKIMYKYTFRITYYQTIITVSVYAVIYLKLKPSLR